jgi:hypothetical protein
MRPDIYHPLALSALAPFTVDCSIMRSAMLARLHRLAIV